MGVGRRSTAEPLELFVGQLIERLGLRRRQLFVAGAPDAEPRLAGSRATGRGPRASTRTRAG